MAVESTAGSRCGSDAFRSNGVAYRLRFSQRLRTQDPDFGIRDDGDLFACNAGDEIHEIVS